MAKGSLDKWGDITPIILLGLGETPKPHCLVNG